MSCFSEEGQGSLSLGPWTDTGCSRSQWCYHPPPPAQAPASPSCLVYGVGRVSNRASCLHGGFCSGQWAEPPMSPESQSTGGRTLAPMASGYRLPSNLAVHRIAWGNFIPKPHQYLGSNSKPVKSDCLGVIFKYPPDTVGLPRWW